jgi:hypothetical protein
MRWINTSIFQNLRNSFEAWFLHEAFEANNKGSDCMKAYPFIGSGLNPPRSDAAFMLPDIRYKWKIPL